VISGAARFATEKAVFRPALPLSSTAGLIGQHMATKLTYAEQLKHPNWQRKRLEMLEAAGWTCSKCGDKEKTLHVHHKQYVKGRKVWEYERHDLAVLCEDCHEAEHAMQDGFELLLSQQWMDKEMDGKEIAFGFLAGFLCPFSKDAAIKKIAEAAIQNDLPFFNLGFMVAALGPDELADAVRRKRDDGRLPDHAFLAFILGEEAGE
jgi:hypothetical protein